MCLVPQPVLDRCTFPSGPLRHGFGLVQSPLLLSRSPQYLAGPNDTGFYFETPRVVVPDAYKCQFVVFYLRSRRLCQHARAGLATTLPTPSCILIKLQSYCKISPWCICYDLGSQWTKMILSSMKKQNEVPFTDTDLWLILFLLRID